MKMEDDICGLLFSFDKKCKNITQVKDTCYRLYHLKKIKNLEVVDPGTIKCLHEDQIVFHQSDDNIKCDMWKVFNNKKRYMSIGSTDQEVVCCSIDIGTAFHDLLNDHYDYIHKDSVCMLRPSVDQFMLKVQKKQESSSREKNRSLMKQFDIYLCCKLCCEDIYQLKNKVNFRTCYEDLSCVFNEHFRKGKENKSCQSLDSNDSYVEKMMSAKK